MWKWEQYFVFSTIRNPYNRMRSSYNYCKPDYHWEEFCQDPSITNGCSASNRPKEKIHSADVHYQFPIHWAYHGWYGWHLDYIIRVEALDKGINEVASIINDRASMRNKSLRLKAKPKNLIRRNPCVNISRDNMQCVAMHWRKQWILVFWDTRTIVTNVHFRSLFETRNKLERVPCLAFRQFRDRLHVFVEINEFFLYQNMEIRPHTRIY